MKMNIKVKNGNLPQGGLKPASGEYEAAALPRSKLGFWDGGSVLDDLYPVEGLKFSGEMWTGSAGVLLGSLHYQEVLIGP